MTGKTRRTKKTGGVDFGIGKDGLDIGVDFKGFKASISTSGVLKLGIGIAAVELNLKDPNESKVSYGFGVYEIEGRREGCTVELIYSIAGEEVKRETRKVPECDEEDAVEPNEREEQKEPEAEDYAPDPPRGLDTNIIVWAFFNYEEHRAAFHTGTYRAPGEKWEADYTFLRQKDNLTKIYRNRHRGISYRNYIVECETTYLGLYTNEKTITVIRSGWNAPDRYPDDISPRLPVEVLNKTSLEQFRYKLGATLFVPTFPYTSTAAYNVFIFNMRTLGDGTAGVCLVIGKGEEVKRYIDEYNQGGLQYLMGYRSHRYRWSGNYQFLFPANIFKPKGHLEDAPPTFTDKRKKEPVMDKKCCAMIERIYEALDIDEILDEEVEIPNRLIASGGTGVKKYNTYLKLYDALIRTLDLGMIHPFKAKVTDANAAQAGNQSVEMEFANATAAAKQIAELLLENKGDSATRLNLMMRTAIAVGQVLNVVSIVAKNVENLINFVGMPIQEKVKLVKMPFDFTFGKRKEKNGKGFGKQNTVSQSGVDALDINTEEATEALLPKFMQDEKQPIVYKQFKPKQPDLIDIIRGKK